VQCNAAKPDDITAWDGAWIAWNLISVGWMNIYRLKVLGDLIVGD
jgi:hypothetical protein